MHRLLMNDVFSHMLMYSVFVVVFYFTSVVLYNSLFQGARKSKSNLGVTLKMLPYIVCVSPLETYTHLVTQQATGTFFCSHITCVLCKAHNEIRFLSSFDNSQQKKRKSIIYYGHGTCETPVS